jgi:hypothetical protein
MPPKSLLLGITVLSIVIIIGGIGYTLVQNRTASTYSTSGNGQPTTTPDTTPEVHPQYPDTNSTDINGEASSTTPDTSGGSDTGGSSSTVSSPQEQIRDQGLAFLKVSKTETAPLMNNLTWSGGRDDLAPMGTERYLYYSIDLTWSVTVESATNSTTTYTISGTYNSVSMTVSFTETYASGVFRITAYSSQRYPSVSGP